MKLIVLIFALLTSTLCNAAELKTDGIVLLQPDFVLQEKGIVVSDLAKYIKAAQSAAVATTQSAELPPSSGFLVLAVREGKKSNAWVDIQPVLPSSIEQSLIQGLRNIPPFQVSKGTVVFAIKIMINGAPPTSRQAPRPAAWQAAFANHAGPVEIESLVQMVWP